MSEPLMCDWLLIALCAVVAWAWRNFKRGTP